MHRTGHEQGRSLAACARRAQESARKRDCATTGETDVSRRAFRVCSIRATKSAPIGSDATAIRAVTIHSGNRRDSRLGPVARGERSSVPPAAAPAFSASHRQACPRAPASPKHPWSASLRSRQGALAVRDERWEAQPARPGSASWPRAAAGREPLRGSWTPKAPRTNERPWQARRRPRGSCRPLPTRTIHDAVMYAHTFGRPTHATPGPAG